MSPYVCVCYTKPFSVRLRKFALLANYRSCLRAGTGLEREKDRGRKNGKERGENKRVKEGEKQKKERKTV